MESVYADYPAAQAGMQAGDVIVEAGGVPIEFSEDGANLLRAIIAAAPVDEPIDFTVERDGERLNFSVAPAAIDRRDRRDRLHDRHRLPRPHLQLRRSAGGRPRA